MEFVLWTPFQSKNVAVYWRRACCRVPYVIKLLREGLGVPEDQVRVGSGQEAWTLGMAIAEGSSARAAAAASSHRGTSGKAVCVSCTASAV